MFDSIDLELALNDLYDVGVNDDTLALLHQANKDVHMAVKTPSGLTDRQVIKNSGTHHGLSTSRFHWYRMCERGAH